MFNSNASIGQICNTQGPTIALFSAGCNNFSLLFLFFRCLNNSLTHHKTKERKESSSNGLLVKTQDRGSEGEGVKVTVCNDEHCFEGSRSSTHSTTPTAQKHYQ